MAGVIKGLRTLVNKVVRENDSVSAATNQAFDAIPADQLKGNKAAVRAAIKDKFESEGVKAKARKGQTKKLERKASDAQTDKSADTPMIQNLDRALQARRNNRKRDLDPTKTSEEAGRSAARVALSMTSKQRQALQKSYNGKKAQVAWLKENDPKSPMIADLQKEMAKMRQRASIDTGVSVSPKKPAGASTPAERNKNERMAMIRAAAKKVEEKKLTEGAGKILSDDVTKNEMARGGKATKKAIGATDYRFNKGGLLLSSVDNRKKK